MDVKVRLTSDIQRLGQRIFSASVSPQNRINVINYIKNQQEHHKDKPFDSEIMWLYKQAGLQWHDDDMT